jgi:hypothetical protein
MEAGRWGEGGGEGPPNTFAVAETKIRRLRRHPVKRCPSTASTWRRERTTGISRAFGVDDVVNFAELAPEDVAKEEQERIEGLVLGGDKENRPYVHSFCFTVEAI